MSPALEQEYASRTLIRPASVQDIDWIVGQLEAFTRWTATKRSLRGSDEFWRAGLAAIIESHVFLIAEKDVPCEASPSGWIKLPVGLIAGTLAPHPFNPRLRILAESFWWVDPNHRNGRAGLLLLEEFISIGRAKADWISMSLEANTPVKDRALLERGFRHFETNYLLEVE